MARAHLKHRVVDRAGNAIQNALVNVRQPGSTSAVTVYTSSTGTTTATSRTSNAQGEIEAFLDLPQRVDLQVTDNTDTAYYPSTPTTLISFATFTESVSVFPAPENVAGDPRRYPL